MHTYVILICSILICCIDSTALASASSSGQQPDSEQTVSALLYSEGVRRYEPGQFTLSTEATKRKLIKRIGALETEQTFEPSITAEINNFNSLITDARQIAALFQSRYTIAEQFYQTFEFTHRYEQPWRGQALRRSIQSVDPNSDEIVQILPLDHLYTLAKIQHQFNATDMKIQNIRTFLNKVRTGDKDTDRLLFIDLKDYYISALNKEPLPNIAPRDVDLVESARTWFNKHNVTHMISTLSPDEISRREAAWDALATEIIDGLRESERIAFSQAVAQGRERNPIQDAIQIPDPMPVAPPALPVNPYAPQTVRIPLEVCTAFVGSTAFSLYCGTRAVISESFISKKTAVIFSLFPAMCAALCAFLYRNQPGIEIPHWKASTIASLSLMGLNTLLWRQAYLNGIKRT